jgi:hypothetical protein
MMGQGGMGQQGMPGQGGMMAPGGQSGMMMGPGMMGQGGMMGRGMMGMMGMGPGMMMGHACDAMAGNVERGLANAKYELKITEAQEPAWQAYANAEREAAKMMTARCTAMANEGGAMLPLPDRLDRHEQALAVRLDNLRSVNKALKALYGELSETQKSQANNLLNPLGLAMGTM